MKILKLRNNYLKKKLMKTECIQEAKKILRIPFKKK